MPAVYSNLLKQISTELLIIRALQDVSSNKPEKLNDYLTAITRDLCGNETSEAHPKFESQLPMFRRQLLLLMQIV